MMLAIYGLLLFLPIRQSAKIPTMVDLDKMVALYQQLHLPVPPANAPLVDRGYRKDKSGLSLVDCGYYIGRNKHQWHTVWLGIEPDEQPDQPKLITTEAKNFRSLEFEFRDYEKFTQADGGLAMAAIERLRGHNEFALAIYQRWAAPPEHPEFGPNKSDPSKPDQALASLALLHWYNACLDPESDRSVIVIELKSLVNKFPNLDKISEYPVLESTWTSQIPGEKQVKESGPVTETIERLELTINNRYRGGDKVEQLIDSLCDSTMVGSDMENYSIVFTQHSYDSLQALASIGYKAIPQLIAHFDDNRLVRSSKEGMKGFHSGIISVESTCPITAVGTVCANLVTQFSDGHGDFGRGSYNKHAQKEWWAEASKNSDADNCWASLSAKSKFLSEGPMWFAGAHHPDLLLKALDLILGRKDETQIYNLLGAIVRSNLDRKVVIDALVKASKSSITDQAHAGVVYLKKVSPADNDEALIRILKNLPKSTDKPAWLSREAIYGKSVAKSESPEVWNAFLAATKRADLDLKLEMIRNASYAEHTPKALKLYLKYLSAFFDDDQEASEVSDPMKRQHFDLPSLRVKYLALTLSAYELKVRPIPKKTSTVDEWNTFQKAVTEKLAVSNPR